MIRFCMMALAAFGLTNVAHKATAADTLDGKWVVTAMQRDGAADASLIGAVRTHMGDNYQVVPLKGATIQGKLTVDAAAKSVDMTPSTGRYKGMTLKGIYKEDGDTLTICFADAGGDRPTEFMSKKGVVLVTHKKR